MALYAASFLFCVRGGILMVIWPWQVMHIGGGSLAVGAVGGLWMGGYVLCCLFVGPHTDRLGVRRLVMTAAASGVGTTLLMSATSSVAVLLGLIALDGAIAGLMWPPIAGWLTGGQEGHRLNKRLGTFSISWALGAFTGFLLSGTLWGERADPHPYIAFLVASSAAMSTFLVAATARKRHHSDTPTTAVKTSGLREDGADRISAFHWMAVVAGVMAGMTNGVIRYPIVTLMESMSIGPEVHGRIAAIITLAMMCGLFLMGRTTRWHYKKVFLWASQIVMAAAVCAVAFSTSAWDLAFYSIVASLGIAVIFASDLYYSVSGSTRRAASVAVRELRVSAGFGIGSFGGGALIRLIARFTDHQTSIRAIYPIMAVIILLAVLVQAAVYCRKR